MTEDACEIYKSVLNKKWTHRPFDLNLSAHIQQKHNLPPHIAQILAAKNVDLDSIETHLNPKIRTLLKDPYLMLDMQKGVELIAAKIKANKKIVIFGDYDVDGATSSALLKTVFELLKADVSIYIPDRVMEGYGPSIGAFEKFKDEGVDTVITVDCGSAAYSVIEHGKKLGLAIVVIDHHICGTDLPPADAIINPNREGDESGLGYLAAVGVSFCFLVALLRHMEIKDINMLYMLDLVALGTVCDVVPLKGLNRAFVNTGIKLIESRNNIGIKALLQVAGCEGKPIQLYHLGFVLGPRINAGGRVGESILGSQLLTCKNYDEAISIANALDQHNHARKGIELGIAEEAFGQVSKLSKDAALIFIKGDWHQGVIGVVAGKLKERFNKPVAVMAFIKETNSYKASCRSIEGIDFGNAILAAKKLGIVTEGGGHAMAAGFNVSAEKADELQEFLITAFKDKYVSIARNQTHYYESSLQLESITSEFIQDLEKLGPFGSGNQQPKFLINNVCIVNAKIISGAHISCMFATTSGGINARALRGMAWSGISLPYAEILLSKRYNFKLIAHLNLNVWQGNTYPELVVDDVIVD